MTTTKERTESSALSKRQQTKLDKYAVEIRTLIKSTLKSAVRIGQILKDVKENILGYGDWQIWVDKEFEGNIKHDSADNWINLANLYEEYHELYGDGFEKLTLSALYKLSRPSVDPEVKETILQLANEDEPIKRDELDAVVRSYRKVKMAEAGFEPDVIMALSDSKAAEDSKELEAIKRLSNKKRDAVVKLLQSGIADTTREALKIAKLQATPIVEIPDNQVEVVYSSSLKDNHFNNINEINDAIVNFALIEAPLRFDYVMEDLNNFCIELDRVLAPGGTFIMTLGHKGILFAGDRLEPLKPLHVLCLRRQPGHSRSIIGTNIMSASVLAVYGYKPPHKGPKTMLVDLQTIQPGSDPVEGMDQTGGLDEVVNGLEDGFSLFMKSLVNKGDTVLHVIESPQHFSIRDHIKETATELGAEAFLSVK